MPKVFWYDVQNASDVDTPAFLEILKQRGEAGWQLVFVTPQSGGASPGGGARQPHGFVAYFIKEAP